MALRAGVSVGTLYQYFRNKIVLLQAALKRHLAEVTEAVELVCQEQKGETLRKMVSALITSFLEAKTRDAKISVALYSVSSDVDGPRIVEQMGNRFHEAIVRMLATPRDPLTDPQLVASMLQGIMVGASRRMLESGAAEKEGETFRRELIVAACAYVAACSAHVPVKTNGVIRDADKKASTAEPRYLRGWRCEFDIAAKCLEPLSVRRQTGSNEANRVSWNYFRIACDAATIGGTLCRSFPHPLRAIIIR